MVNNFNNVQRTHGITLIELMIAIAVVAIIASIAYPSYQSQMQKTRRSEAQSALIDVIHRQERFYATNNTYTTSLTALNTTALTAEGYYQLTLQQCRPNECDTTGALQPIANCVEVFATAQGNQVADGNIWVDSRGARCPSTKW